MAIPNVRPETLSAAMSGSIVNCARRPFGQIGSKTEHTGMRSSTMGDVTQ